MKLSLKPGTRLAVVLSHPTQYYSPWFQWLSSHSDLEFRVFYLWDFGVSKQRDPRFGTEVEWDVDLTTGYDSEFVPNTASDPGAEHFFGFRNPGLTKRISEWRPTALLLFGYKWASHLRVVAWARCHRVPILFRGDSHLIGRGSPAPLVRFALGTLFSQFASFLYVGSANREYFEAFGVPSRKLFFSPHSVDASLYDPANPVHGERRDAFRAQLGLVPATKMVLFAGKLVADKQPMELLEAFLELDAVDTALVFVGDGPEKARLQRRMSEAPTTARVLFSPFANQSEMPSRYLAAALFVLPSRGVYETWGLAVNEAMLMGTPCLVSDRVGCQRDLVTVGETGWVFRCGEPGSLRAGLLSALKDVRSESRSREIKDAIQKRISGYTYEKTSEGLFRALAALTD